MANHIMISICDGSHQFWSLGIIPMHVE